MEIGFSKEKLHVLQFRYPEVPKDLGKEILTAACPGLRVSDDFLVISSLLLATRKVRFRICKSECG